MNLRKTSLFVTCVGVSLLFQNCSGFSSSKVSLNNLNPSASTGQTGTDGNNGTGGSVDSWISKPAFHSYHFAPKIIREVSTAGVDVFSVDTNLLGDDTGFSSDIAPSAGVWSFSSLKTTLDMIIAANPKAKFVLRTYAGAPTWWKDLSANELEAYSDGCTYLQSKRNSGGVCTLAN